MKWIGLMTLCMSIASVGIYKATQYCKTTEIYRDTARYFAYVSEKTVNSGMSIMRINAQCVSEFQRLTFLSDMAKMPVEEIGYARCWQTALAKFCQRQNLPGQARSRLLAFCQSFEKASLDDFTADCLNVGRYFENLAQKTAEQNPQRCRKAVLFGILGALGMFFVLM